MLQILRVANTSITRKESTLVLQQQGNARAQ
jgi:hypothetical protein